jgi:hypothetical protein
VAAVPNTGGAQELPDTLVGLSLVVLDRLGPHTLVRLTRALDGDQVACLESLSVASDDDEAARAIVGLTQSLKATPAGLGKLQGLLTPPQLGVFLQLADLANRHLAPDAGNAGDGEGAGSSAAK